MVSSVVMMKAQGLLGLVLGGRRRRPVSLELVEPCPAPLPHLAPVALAAVVTNVCTTTALLAELVGVPVLSGRRVSGLMEPGEGRYVNVWVRSGALVLTWRWRPCLQIESPPQPSRHLLR